MFGLRENRIYELMEKQLLLSNQFETFLDERHECLNWMIQVGPQFAHSGKLRSEAEEKR